MSPNPISHDPPSLGEVRRRRRPVRDVNAEHNSNLSPVDRLALVITERVGTMGFFFIIVVWTLCWLGWNFLAPPRLKFDPPMGFVFWLFISNMIQIFLMPLIMVGQNLQSRHAELRAQNDFEVNVKAEKEIEVILLHLEYQNSILLQLVRKQGITLEEISSGQTTPTAETTEIDTPPATT